MKKTIVILTKREKIENQVSNEIIKHIIDIWEGFQDEEESPTFFIIPYRKLKIRPEGYTWQNTNLSREPIIC